MNRLTVSVLLCIAWAFLTVSATSSSAKDRLTRDLLKDYHAGIDPGTIELEIGIAAVCARFDKSTKVATFNVWEVHSWKDSRLAWNPADYSGVDKIRIPSKLVWHPDTEIYNSLTSYADRDSQVNAVIASDGNVLWVPKSTYRIHCTENNSGEAACKLRIGSWTYDGNNLILKQYGPDGLDLSNYDEACPSVISSHKAEIVNHKYPCCEEPYPSLDIVLTIKSRDD